MQGTHLSPSASQSPCVMYWPNSVAFTMQSGTHTPAPASMGGNGGRKRFALHAGNRYVGSSTIADGTHTVSSLHVSGARLPFALPGMAVRGTQSPRPPQHRVKITGSFVGPVSQPKLHTPVGLPSL